MKQRIVVGPQDGTLRNDRTAFFIDNDSFPKLINAYPWRGRVKRKRGTEKITRLKRYFDSTSSSFNRSFPLVTTQTLSGAGVGNLITGFIGSGIETSAQIVPGSLDFLITDTVSLETFTDNGDGTLTGSLLNAGTIDYSTGSFTILASAGNPINAQFNYFPCLPVMGIEDYDNREDPYPETLDFDTVYSYNQNTTSPYSAFNISFYKNVATGAFTGYVQKSSWTPYEWNGQDYQQFWSLNYQNAFWATNGMNVPFVPTNIGMQYKALSVVTVISGTDVDFTTTNNHPFVEGDFVFINEVNAVTGLNFQTGYVLGAPAPTATTFRARFPNATIAGGPGNTGIVQALTSNCQPDVSSQLADSVRDCIKFYDGLPISSGNTFQTNHGWVNYCPPLSLLDYSISDLVPDQYYLVGAKLIVSFKDRLLFLGPVVQTSAVNSQVYLQDTVIYTQNGTPYYTASFPYTGITAGGINSPTAAELVTAPMTPVLLPLNQTSNPGAAFNDLDGYGGFIQAGYDKPITTVTSNEDVLLLGFNTNIQARFVYTGNDLVPFNFYVINSELGDMSTFSAINLDRGKAAVGTRGITLTSQISTQRIDGVIPDEIFQFNQKNNGQERVTAARDFINEWIYFTYSFAGKNTDPLTDGNYFPNQTLFFNYRDNSWAIFQESYTTYGIFRRQTGETWDDLNYFTWDEWTDPWDSGENNLLQPEVIAGNQQGYIISRAKGTGEDPSGYISAISGFTITSPNHNLVSGDYIVISSCIGTVSQFLNERIFEITNPTTNTFQILPTANFPSSVTGTYLGNGEFTKIYNPFIQTKQFPTSWEYSRKTRIGAQQYLLSATTSGQVTLNIYLSQDGNNAYNSNPIVPAPNATNSSLVYSTVLYTCPESTNLGLTAPNTNLQMLTAPAQAQIWHRMNTSLIGDTVQVGITLSRDQLRTLSRAANPVTITNITQALQAVVTANNNFVDGMIVRFQDIVGMVELNGNEFFITSATPTDFTIDLDTTGFTAYVSGGTATPVSAQSQFAEIELHSFILEVSPSQLLA